METNVKCSLLSLEYFQLQHCYMVVQSASVNVAANKHAQGQTQIYKTVFLFVAAFHLFGDYFRLHSADANCNEVSYSHSKCSSKIEIHSEQTR
jgi:hypothetical protein